jgi:hypothetical protein
MLEEWFMAKGGYSKKNGRGSSPHLEMKQGFDDWVKRLRSLELHTQLPLLPGRKDKKITIKK